VKKFFSIVITSFLIGNASYAIADKIIKIGYVDMQEALNVSEAGKKAKDVFKGEVDRMQKDLDKQQADLKKMNEELEKQAFLLSEETRAKKEKEYQEKLKNFKRFYQDSQEKLQEKDAQLTRKIIIDLRKIIEEMGSAQGYTLIFEKNESSLLYADKGVDLTNEVVKKYNAKKK